MGATLTPVDSATGLDDAAALGADVAGLAFDPAGRLYAAARALLRALGRTALAAAEPGVPPPPIAAADLVSAARNA